jgi:hypothetical protein
MVHRRAHGHPWQLSRLQTATTEVLRRAERAGYARLTRDELVERIRRSWRLMESMRCSGIKCGGPRWWRVMASAIAHPVDFMCVIVEQLWLHRWMLKSPVPYRE